MAAPYIPGVGTMASSPFPPLGQVLALRIEHKASVHKLIASTLAGLEVEPKAAYTAST